MGILKKIVLPVGGIAVVVILSMNACKRVVPAPLPVGPVTMTGTLLKTELSLTRRGTHLLRQYGKDIVYVESHAVSLREYEGLDIALHGILEANTNDFDLSVLLADTVTLVQFPSRHFEIPSLHVSFSVPTQWAAVLFDDGFVFSQTGAIAPRLRVSRSALTSLPNDVRILVGGHGAVRVHGDLGDAVFIQNGRDIIVFSFGVQESARILSSIQFSASSSSLSGTGSLRTGSGSHIKGAACGGAAGILCPDGQYCEVTDQAAGIGVCTALRGLP